MKRYVRIPEVKLSESAWPYRNKWKKRGATFRGDKPSIWKAKRLM